MRLLWLLVLLPILSLAGMVVIVVIAATLTNAYGKPCQRCRWRHGDKEPCVVPNIPGATWSERMEYARQLQAYEERDR